MPEDAPAWKTGPPLGEAGATRELEVAAGAPRTYETPDVSVAVRRAVGAAARSTLGVAGWYERQALQLLRGRLDTVAPARRERANDEETPELRERMDHLLVRALEQTAADAESELFHRILDQLTPDEARIIGALSDGSVTPTVTVLMRTRTGLPGEPILANMSLIGKSANLALPDRTALYVTRLLASGLLERGPESVSLKEDYEILGADPLVLRAIRQATIGPIPPRIERGTLHLTPLAHDLWRATTGTAG